MKFSKYIFFLIFLFSFVVIAVVNVSDLGPEPLLKRKYVFIPPPKNIKYFTLGYHESFADSLWLRWIQDLDTCGKETISRQSFEKNFENFKEDHSQLDLKLGYDRSKRNVCDKGWSFKMLDAITDLSPKFRMPYAVGATNLSVLTEDHEGAKIIFEKGVKNFPHDWPILYRAAYLYLFELNDLEMAAKMLNQAGDVGAPLWVKSLAARLYSRVGQLQLGIISLKQYLKHTTNEEQKAKIRARILELEEKLAKKAK